MRGTNGNSKDFTMAFKNRGKGSWPSALYSYTADHGYVLVCTVLYSINDTIQVVQYIYYL